MRVVTQQKIFIWVIFLLCISILSFGVWRYISSSLLIAKANQLYAQDQPETAILLYQQARSTFPFRRDIETPLRRAKILLHSELKFEDKTQSIADLPKHHLPVPTTVPF